MNVSFMKEFITFVKTLNYTKAANELFLSQPTLRAHIRAIECELGGPLVAKRDGQLTLTPMGRLFLKKARVIVADFDEMLEECSALARSFHVFDRRLLGTSLDRGPVRQGPRDVLRQASRSDRGARCSLRK